MPVSEISGVTMGPNAVSNPLMDFAEHLQRARANDRLQAQQQLDFMMKLTEQSGGRFTPDPKELEKVAKRAGLPATILGGEGGVQGAFGGMAEAFRQKEKTATEQAQAQLEQTRAGTAAQVASTKQIEQQTAIAKEHQVQEGLANEALKRITSNSYTGSDEEKKGKREGDAIFYIAVHGGDPGMVDKLSLTPSERVQAEAQAKEIQEYTLKTTRTNFATMLSQKVIVDPKTKQPRNLTPQEVDAFLKGNPIPGLMTRAEFDDMTMKAAQAGAETLRARADMMRAEATRDLSQIEKDKREAEIKLTLAKANALRDKGISHDFEDILKSYQALRDEKAAGGKPDPKLMRQLEVEMARAFGGDVKTYHDWLGREQESFEFPRVEGSAAGEALSSVAQPRQLTPAEKGAGYAREIKGAAKKLPTAVGEAAETGQETAGGFIRELFGLPPMTPEQLEAMKKGPKYPPPFGP